MTYSSPPDIPGYSLVMALSQSDTSAVYLALEERTGRELALKLIRPTCDEPALQAGLQTLKTLAHPHLVSFQALGICEGWAYLAMEHLPGRSLDHQRFEWDFPTSLSKLRGLAEALDFAADQGCFTASVCPENILLAGSDERPVLVGFSPCPRVFDSSASLPLDACYLAPEHLQNTGLDGRAYVYSLGMLLYLLLTEHLPMSVNTLVALRDWQKESLPPHLPSYLASFQPLLDGALTSHPDQRFPDCRALVTALESLPPSAMNEAILGAEKEVLSSSSEPAFSAQTRVIIRQMPMTLQLEPISAGGLDDAETDEELEAFSPVQLYDSTGPARAAKPWLMSALIIAVMGVVFYLVKIANLSPQVLTPPASLSPSPAPDEPAEAHSTGIGEPMLSLEDQAALLRVSLSNDLGSAQDLMVIYRAALRGDDPSEQDFGRRGIEEVQERFSQSIATMLASGDREGARKLGEQVPLLFDREEWLPVLSDALAATED